MEVDLNTKMVTGDMLAAADLAKLLLRVSSPFSVVPLPQDKYEFMVKEEVLAAVQAHVRRKRKWRLRRGKLFLCYDRITHANRRNPTQKSVRKGR
jgi:hypothetical protein